MWGTLSLVALQTWATRPDRRPHHANLSPGAQEPMFIIHLICTGIPEEVGVEAAIDITEEFRHRSWHKSVLCRWSNGALHLEATNDFDSDGKALVDEFSDAISAYVAGSFDGDILIESVLSPSA
jgi:hypothetical protein